MINVLHVAIEYKGSKVGGLGAVTSGLLPAIAKKDAGVTVSIITPFYDVYNGYYADLEQLAIVDHIYKGVKHTSCIYRAGSEQSEGELIYHYLVKPLTNPLVKRLFDVEEQRKIYLPFEHSHPRNRMEFFNSAVAAFVRMPVKQLPIFDIVHLHTWHTGLSGCLIKEFENLKNYQTILQVPKNELKPIPYVFFTIHMLLEREHGYVREPHAIKALFNSVGLPDNFETSFPELKSHIRGDHLKLHALGLVYADHVGIVSKSVIKEIFNGVAHGLEDIFNKLQANQRFVGITNGIPYKDWDATSRDNLGDFAFNISSVIDDKQRIKNFLVSKYPQLDPSKNWFLFVGRFANEKGVDLLPAALGAIRNQDAILIVMGIQVTIDKKNAVSMIIEGLKEQTDVLVIEDPQEQQAVGKLIRAASNFTLVLSNNETGGIVPMEAQACGSITIASKIQGLPDSVIPYDEKSYTGTGFLFDYDKDTREENLKQAIIKASEMHAQWYKEGFLDSLLGKLIIEAKRFDWDAEASEEYIKTYKSIVNRPVLTFDQVHSTVAFPAILNQFNSKAASSSLKKLPGKIFQIGFNKSGTQSLINLFWENHVPSIHYGNGKLASSIMDNYKNNRPLISAEYARFIGFFDMENIYSDPPVYVAQTLFKDLDKQYPGSKFILNTRSIEAWIKSRCKHIDIENNKSYVEVLCEKYKSTKDGLIEQWRQEWDIHHHEVLNYFKDRPNDLLVFNIESDGPEKICEFFKEYFSLNPKFYKHLNSVPSALVLKPQLIE